MTELRVLIISDDYLARAGLAALLQTEDLLNIVGQVDSSADLQTTLDAYQPDVLLWDLGWEVEATFDALADWIEDSAPDGLTIGRETATPSNDGLPPMLALISHENDIGEVWSVGVRNVLLRTSDGNLLAAALTAAAAGLLVLDPALSSAMAPASDTAAFQSTASDILTSESASARLVEPLTPRELEVLQLIAQGHPNKSIARELEISEHTVKFHVNAILGKFNAASRTEAVVRATQAGLLLL